MLVLGLDEAGRGSVLGPMAVGAYLVDRDRIGAVVAAGATDSKKLSARKRAAVRERLQPLGAAEVVLVSAREIDAENINTIEERVFVELIARHRPERLELDAPVHPRGIPALVARMRAALEARGVPLPEMVVEPKADLNHPAVGAASIFAKLARDAAIAELGPVGSGYPSDPVTRAWILDHIRRDAPLPACVRSRWGTIDKLRQQALFS
jgi:ribonuclease HII